MSIKKHNKGRPDAPNTVIVCGMHNCISDGYSGNLGTIVVMCLVPILTYNGYLKLILLI